MSQPTNIPRPSGDAAGAAVRQLIANRKFKAALECAREFHKAERTAASEALLTDAYAARIAALFEQNLTLEARSLLELVRERYPAAKSLWDELAAASALRSGSLDELLQPLNDPSLPAEHRIAVEQAIRQRVSDLTALAGSRVLPEGHALRVAAAALDRAFTAVTSGPVSEEQLALPEVSHRSPLAPWKLLVRAIAAFHQGEDGKCEEYLDAIPPESVPARLVGPIRGLLGTGDGLLSPAASALAARFGDKSAVLKNALEQLEQAFTDEDKGGRLLRAVRSSMQEARKPGQTTPEQLERLRRHIYVRGAMRDLADERLIAALDGPPHRGAELSRLLASGLEKTSDETSLVMAARIWADFVQDGIREKWFPAGGVEEAAVYLHMAELAGKVPGELLEEIQRKARADFRSVAAASVEETEVYFPEKLFEHACALDPHGAAYSKWMRWASGRSVTLAESVAKQWNKACPADIEPLIWLMERAERRNAFPRALGLLEKAERLDAVHPAVRAGRLRLLSQNLIVHLQQRKPHLAARKLALLNDLPQTRQGDRPAVLAAFQYVLADLENDRESMSGARAEMMRVLGSEIAAGLLVAAVNSSAKHIPERLPPLKTLNGKVRESLPVDIARVGALVKEFRMTKLPVPLDYLNDLKTQIRTGRGAPGQLPLDTSQLETLADMGLRANHPELTYQASGAGLDLGGATEARFLLLRARCLPEWLSDRREACAAAAAELARVHRDTEVVEQAVELDRVPFDPEPLSLKPGQATEVVRREKAARQFPSYRDPGPAYEELFQEEPCQCPDCRARRGELFDPPEKDEEFDEGEMRRLFDERVPEGMPPEVANAMYELMKAAALGGVPPEAILGNLPGGPRPRGGKKKGRRK